MERLTEFQTGNPQNLSLYYMKSVAAGQGKLFETILHREVSHLHERGEWFNLSVDEAIHFTQNIIIEYGAMVESLNERQLVLNSG